MLHVCHSLIHNWVSQSKHLLDKVNLDNNFFAIYSRKSQFSWFMLQFLQSPFHRHLSHHYDHMSQTETRDYQIMSYNKSVQEFHQSEFQNY